MILAGEIISPPVKKLVNKGKSSIHFAITVYYGEIYVLLSLSFLNGSFYCYFIVFVLLLLVILLVVKFVI